MFFVEKIYNAGVKKKKKSSFINRAIHLTDVYNCYFPFFVSGKLILSSDIDETSQYRNEEKDHCYRYL